MYNLVDNSELLFKPTVSLNFGKKIVAGGAALELKEEEEGVAGNEKPTGPSEVLLSNKPNDFVVETGTLWQVDKKGSSDISVLEMVSLNPVFDSLSLPYETL